MILRVAARFQRVAYKARWLNCFLLATLCGLAVANIAPAADGLDLRLHFAWGGGQSRQWRGRVAFSSGTLSDLQLLGLEADQPGSIQVLGQQILIRQKQPRSYDGFEVTVQAAADATARIEMLAEGELQARVVELSLAQLAGEYRSETLDDEGNRIVIRRSPSDLIRVELNRDHLVFSPGETWRVAIRGHRLGVPAGTSLRCRLALSPARSRTSIWSEERRQQADSTGSWPEAELLELELPRDEGVYELEAVMTARRWTPSFTPDKVVARRRVQLVVLADQAAPTETADERVSVLGIDPTQANWFQRTAWLPQWSLLPGFRADGRLGNVKAERIQRGERAWTSLPVGAWQAYPLAVDSIGTLHELELEYAGDVEQTFSVSIVEPNAAGKVIPVGQDSGVFVSAEFDKLLAARPPEVSRHRLLFWPQSKAPLLLITNLSDQQATIYGKFEVFRRSLPAMDPPLEGRRQAIAFFERPWFPEVFGAAEALDEESGRSLEDWQTFLDGARRLIQYAKYVGYDALAVTCASEGSTLYPSQLLQPTAKHDRGIFFSQAQDPVRKDVLELMFRLCDREGLRLIPVMEFASPLPALEARLLQPDQAEGLALVDAAQATWLQRFDAQRGRAAYYNPLDERVQQAMLAAVDELLARYADHQSFAGLTINLHADGYTQLPDVDWGMDARTWDRFRRERQVKLARPDLLDAATREAWLEWRCEQLTAFYAQMAQRVASYRGQSSLYLAGARLIESRPVQRAFRPSLPPQSDLDAALRELGLSATLLRGVPNLVLLRPQLFVPPQAPVASPATTEFNASLEVAEFLRQTTAPAAEFLHEPRLMRLPSFDEASPFGKANTFLSLVAQVSPSGVHNRRRFAHALATEDVQLVFEGGWTLPMGQEESLRDFLRVYRQLPQMAFDSAEDDRRRWQPLQVRARSTTDATYLYAVNDSPWYVGASIKLQAAADTQFELLDTRPQPGVRRERDAASWHLTLAPYDLVALRADQPGVRVDDVVTNLPPDVKPALEHRIRTLGVRAARLAHPEPLSQPANRGFELWDASAAQPLDWTVRGRTESVSLDASLAHEGKSALRVQLPSGSLSLRSQPFDVPASGRLSVSIWARTTDPQQQPRVRLVLDVDGRLYHPWSAIGTGGGQRTLETGWKEFVFRVSQLPPVTESLKIGLEVAGTGDVYLDDIRLYDMLVLDAAEHKALAHLLAGADYQRRMGMVADCVRTLDGYWPQYLMANVAEAAPEIADRPPAAADEPAAVPAPREASNWNPIKRLLPRR